MTTPTTMTCLEGVARDLLEDAAEALVKIKTARRAAERGDEAPALGDPFARIAARLAEARVLMQS